MELVSIITPTYNSSNFISYTIKSIIEQSYENWELLITDDCSTDNTLEIVKGFAVSDPRIKLFCLSKNSGPGVARNNSIYHSKGRFIAFCDSDDIWLPNKLVTQISFMKKNKISFTYSSYLIKGENDIIFGKVQAPILISYQDILSNNYIGCLTVIYDSEALGKNYMDEFSKREDWLLWITIIKKLKLVKGIKAPLAIYTKRNNSLSSNKIKLLKDNWLIYNKSLGFNKFFSSLLMIRFIYFYFKKKLIK